MNLPQRACIGLCIGLSLAVLADCRREARGTGDVAGEVRIAAASSLSIAFRELESAFEREHGRTLTVVYGASGFLATQIGQGAPFDAFYSADEAFAGQVVETGACDGTTRRVYAQGHMVVWTRQPASAMPLVDLSSLLEPGYQRIAIADPAQSPYGRAARATLERAGLWDALASRIVLGEDVQKAFQQVESGQAEAGLVSLSLALNQGGRFVSLDDSLHAPLTQVTVQCKHGKSLEGARAFDRFVASENGAAILRSHGYVIPAP